MATNNSNNNPRNAHPEDMLEAFALDALDLEEEENVQAGIFDGYLSEREFADEVGRCVRTLRRWHSLRQGPARTSVGKAIYYRRDAVAEWLASLELAA